ncbi:MAG TPA: site-specific integrase, partial [Terracidiphilus sp.]|nr:site-specific integrase [Terracidiphilus sp.]
MPAACQQESHSRRVAPWWPSSVLLALPGVRPTLSTTTAGNHAGLPKAHLGARRGEVLALRWSDLKDGRFEITRSLTQTAGTVSFKTTKSGEPRRVSLPPGPEFSAKLDAHRKRQDQYRQRYGADYRTDLDLIFANQDGTPLKPDSISASVSLLCRRLGLPKGASLHTLRHTHASHLLADGVDLATVSERLGHSSVRVTAEIYSHAIR